MRTESKFHDTLLAIRILMERVPEFTPLRCCEPLTVFVQKIPRSFTENVWRIWFISEVGRFVYDVAKQMRDNGIVPIEPLQLSLLRIAPE
ncbi:MAG: hypothetical protein U1D26_00120 [Patescibacteria group bacterium]|nr:hypothetical protein [Patescibacteria group bacterium]